MRVDKIYCSYRNALFGYGGGLGAGAGLSGFPRGGTVSLRPTVRGFLQMWRVEDYRFRQPPGRRHYECFFDYEGRSNCLSRSFTSGHSVATMEYRAESRAM